jgi:predicted nuclease of predicted toxin-antitoxin system
VAGELFFDRNVPAKAVTALKVLRADVVGHGDLFEPAEQDEVIAREVARLGHCLVTRDARMATRPRQRRVLLDARLHVFVNADGGNLETWDFFVLLVRNFAAIERILVDEEPAIFFYTRSSAPYLRYFLTESGEMVSATRTSRRSRA